MTRVLAFVATAAATAAATAGVFALTGGPDAPRSHPRFTAPDRSFSVALPQGWRVQASGTAATVLARSDRAGLVVVRRQGRMRADVPRLGRALERRLVRELPGARPAGNRLFPTPGGEALLTTLVRGGRVHGVAVVPAGAHSYSLDLVAAGGAHAAARELATVVRSFRPAIIR